MKSSHDLLRASDGIMAERRNQIQTNNDKTSVQQAAEWGMASITLSFLICCSVYIQRERREENHHASAIDSINEISWNESDLEHICETSGTC